MARRPDPFGDGKAEFVPWKPDRCEEPGCDARWPSFSRDGGKGPWRCAAHDRTATRSAEPEFAAPTPKRQDRLL